MTKDAPTLRRHKRSGHGYARLDGRQMLRAADGLSRPRGRGVGSHGREASARMRPR
jgi:hypothetical protein